MWRLMNWYENFEITINSKTDKKGKGIAFKSNFETDETRGNHEDDSVWVSSTAWETIQKYFLASWQKIQI